MLYGAIAGDMIGSDREFLNPPIKTKEFPLFTSESQYTDDSIMTCAIAHAILNNGDYGEFMHYIGSTYLHNHEIGWGHHFFLWLTSTNPKPYNSFGNGSAMRVSSVGWAFDSIDDVLKEAEKTALPTHNHPEGIKGAQATALAVFLARKGADNSEIKSEIVSRFGYDLERTVDSIRSVYHFDVTCQGSVPESIICFLEANSYEDAVRNAVSLGGDTDTQGAITGSIAEARWGVPYFIKEEVDKRLDDKLLSIVRQFNEKFNS